MRFYQAAHAKMQVARGLFEQFPDSKMAATTLMEALDNMRSCVHAYWLISRDEAPESGGAEEKLPALDN